MTSPEPAQGASPLRLDGDVDVLVIGGGITGIYQLFRAREAGFSAVL
jgi:glycerol-3-phosphate dehydrogenase